MAVTSPLYCKANLFQVSLASLLSRILFLPGSSAYSLLPSYRPFSSLWNELEGPLSRDSSIQCKQILHSRGLMIGKGEKVGSECLMWSSQRISQVQKKNHFIDFSQLFFVLSFVSGISSLWFLISRQCQALAPSCGMSLEVEEHDHSHQFWTTFT